MCGNAGQDRDGEQLGSSCWSTTSHQALGANTRHLPSRYLRAGWRVLCTSLAIKGSSTSPSRPMSCGKPWSGPTASRAGGAGSRTSASKAEVFERDQCSTAWSPRRCPTGCGYALISSGATAPPASRRQSTVISKAAARLLLVPASGGTRVSASWTLEMTQRRMRTAARIAHLVLRWGHDRVIDATVRNFRRHLARST